jgi:hypothetical protein
MAVTVKAVNYYKGTGVGDQEWAGFEVARRVLRYTLEVTGEGATSITLVHKYINYGSYSSAALCASLTTDGEAYINANGEENGYQVEATKDTTERTYTVTMDGLMLLPGQTYYLWLYPKTDAYAFAYLYSDSSNWTLTAEGSVGVVYIETAEGFGVYLCYIEDGTEWALYILYIEDGTEWAICS